MVAVCLAGWLTHAVSLLCRCYRGHSSHVTDVRFLCDDRMVLSVGGHDRGIYQWRTCGINVDDAEQDAAVLAAIDAAVEQKKEGRLTLVPKPLAKWGQLDSSGKHFGPVEDVQRIRESSTGGNRLGMAVPAAS